jgi:lipoyl(octanoyl) transferase
MKLKILSILSRRVNAESSGNNTQGTNPQEKNTAGKKAEGSSTQQWEFIDSGFQTARYNMDYDLMLVERCKTLNKSFFRVYRWKPYAISLGYNQNKALNELTLNFNKCKTENIDIVQRPTGGRAVFHAEELTYSVVFKSNRPVRDLYRDISMALLDGLKSVDPKLFELSFSKDTPDLLKLIKTGMYNLCFNSQVKYEINWRGKKVVGSAQRKFGDIVLQHGSILLGPRHKDIVDYLNVSGEQRVKMKQEIEDKTACINEICGRNVTYDETARALLKGFEKGFNIKFSKINRLANHFPGNREVSDKILN